MSDITLARPGSGPPAGKQLVKKQTSIGQGTSFHGDQATRRDAKPKSFHVLRHPYAPNAIT